MKEYSINVTDLTVEQRIELLDAFVVLGLTVPEHTPTENSEFVYTNAVHGSDLVVSELSIIAPDEVARSYTTYMAVMYEAYPDFEEPTEEPVEPPTEEPTGAPLPPPELDDLSGEQLRELLEFTFKEILRLKSKEVKIHAALAKKKLCAIGVGS